MALTEFRLWAGFLHCPLAFLGVRQVPDLHELILSAEMRPWDIGGRYNRPLARRIIESGGIPRGAFAVHKRAGSVLFFQRDSFLSPSSLEDYTRWLREQTEAWRRQGLVPPAPVPGRRTLQQKVAAVAGGVVRSVSWADGAPTLARGGRRSAPREYRGPGAAVPLSVSLGDRSRQAALRARARRRYGRNSTSCIATEFPSSALKVMASGSGTFGLTHMSISDF